MCMEEQENSNNQRQSGAPNGNEAQYNAVNRLEF